MTFEEWFGQDLTGTTYEGNLHCSNKGLTSLKGCPETVNGNFYCSGNKLTSLKGCPQTVNGTFFCSYNQLTSLQHCPQTVNGDFRCSGNQLKTLDGLKYYENFYSDFSNEEVQAYYEEHYPECLI